MVQLEFLNEQEKRRFVSVRRFPFCAGRSSGTHLQLEAKGVWDQHVALTLDRDGGVRAVALPGALLTINGEPVQEKILSPGDVLGLGAVELRFSLAPARVQNLRTGEWGLWALLGLIVALQGAALYFLWRWA